MFNAKVVFRGYVWSR